MPDIDALVSQLPMDELARQLGVSESDAEGAVRQALPALLGGMSANAQDPAGAASLANALGQHDNDLLDGGVDFDKVDTADGEKIVRNVFGDNEEQVVNTLGGLGGGGSGTIAKLLPILAPLVMTFLAKQMAGGGKSGAGGGLGDILGGGAGGGGLGDILGGLLGGGQDGASGGIGDILGGLLGGGKR